MTPVRKRHHVKYENSSVVIVIVKGRDQELQFKYKVSEDQTSRSTLTIMLVSELVSQW